MGDAISIVEKAYQTGLDDREWLTGLCNTALSASGATMAIANFFDARDIRRPRLSSGVSLPDPSAYAEIAMRTQELLEGTPGANEALFAACDVSTMSERLQRNGISYEPIRRVFEPYGIQDIVGLPAFSPDRRGIVFGFGVTTVRALTALERKRWQRVATHAAAGLRLRVGVARDAVPEAVLRPDGRVEHAEGAARPKAARELLRSAARAVDRVRSRPSRQDPDAALELWRGLVAGRWSLVDHFESDGRRYLVARRNDPDVPSAPLLSRREAQVAGYAALGHGNKLIAYELGLAVSTVATHLAAAQRKLGLRSRLELAPMAAQGRS